MQLENKIAVVTGAASGIGRACAEGLAKAGAIVIAVDRNGEGVDETVHSIGDRASAHQVDLIRPGGHPHPAR